MLGVLAMTATIVVLNAPPSRNAAQEEAETFAARLQKGMDDALFSGKPIRMEIDSQGYRFAHFENRRWRVKDDPALREASFKGSVIIKIEAEQAAIKNVQMLDGDMVEAQKKHFVHLDPIGVSTPVTVRFGNIPEQVTVVLSGNGKIRVVRDDN